MLRTIDDLSVNRRLLVRLDLNAPVDDGVVRDNARFERHARTLAELVDAGHRIACLAHQGRPGRDTFVTLEQHADILADHLDRPVQYVPDTHGDEALAAIRGLEAGEVCLLENVRMTDDELPERSPAACADTDLVRSLAPEFDAYVNDAYSAAHRSQTSIVGFPEVLPAYAGRVMVTEYEANTAIATREFDGEVTMVLGGTKTGDMVDVIEALGDRVDSFLLGGIPGELFLRAAGHDVGYDLDDSGLYGEQWKRAGERVEKVLDSRDDVHLPTDLAYVDETGKRQEIAVEAIDRKAESYDDVGTETTMAFGEVVRDSAAVLVKGALGRFEDERFSVGTVGLLESISECDCFSVVGGGDTSRAIDMYGFEESAFSHVSIAGGAYLRALTGEPLPAVEALERAAERMAEEA